MNSLKKLLLIPIIFISMLFINNKTYAQVITNPVYPNEEYPYMLRRIYFQFTRDWTEHAFTYEFTLKYWVDAIFSSMDDIGDDYYLVTTLDIPLQRGLNYDVNSYQISYIQSSGWYVQTDIFLLVTLDKSFVDENYSLNEDDENYIDKFFDDYTELYIRYIPVDSTDYSDGYTAGYNDGEEIGYDKGYNEGRKEGLEIGYWNGYNNGYEFGQEDGYIVGKQEAGEKYRIKGYKEGYIDAFNNWFYNVFDDNINIWIIPAIIILFGIGIFVAYRRERE